jgi:hypothetical protein
MTRLRGFMTGLMGILQTTGVKTVALAGVTVA